MSVESSIAAKLSVSFDSHLLAVEMDMEPSHNPAIEMGVESLTDLDIRGVIHSIWWVSFSTSWGLVVMYSAIELHLCKTYSSIGKSPHSSSSSKESGQVQSPCELFLGWFSQATL